MTSSLDGRSLRGCDLLIVGSHDRSAVDALHDELGSDAPRILTLKGAIRWFIRSPLGPDFLALDAGEVPAGGQGEGAGRIRNYDLRTLLGRASSSTPVPVGVDEMDGRLLGLLGRICEAAGGVSASIMLPDAEARYLHVVGCAGPRRDRLKGARVRLGEGVAGRAFLQGEPTIVQRRIPTLAEHPDPGFYRTGVSIPLKMDGRAYGVLSVNLESTEEAPSFEKTLCCLERKVKSATRVLLGAICVDPVHVESDDRILREVVDRLMGLDENSLARLCAVTDALGKGLRAECHQLLVVDRPTRSLQRVSLDCDLYLELERWLPADRGLLGWILEHGKARILELHDEESGDHFTTAFVPLRSPRTDAIVLMEGIECPEQARSRGIEMLEEVAHCVEEMLVVEENISDRDLVSELGMRIADEVRDLQCLPADESVDRALDMAIRIFAADHAVWCPQLGGTPTVASGSGAERGPSADPIRSCLGSLTEWVLAEGGAYGAPDMEAAPDAPRSPVPFVGVRHAAGQGALLVFFSAHDLGTFHQISPEVLLQALRRLCDLIACPEADAENPSEVPDAAVTGDDPIETPVPLGDVLIVESGGMRAGVPWSEVRGVGALGMSAPRVGCEVPESQWTVSLGELLGARSCAEQHSVLVSDGRPSVRLMCEHLGGLVAEARMAELAHAGFRVLRAADLSSYLPRSRRAA